MIASNSEEIYKLKRKIRKHNESILQLKQMQFKFRIRYKTKSEPKYKTEDETAGSKRLKRV